MSVRKIGKYRVLDKIGAGGSGGVYIVADDRIGKKWAMKELPKSQKGTGDGLFVLKRLDHPALPRIVEELEDQYYVYEVMDYVEGTTLRKYAEAGKIHSITELLHILREISDIIAYLHGQEPPVIFRDIKPDNFIVTPAGNIKLIDFDIALLGEQTGTFPLGTKGYAAPEQYSGICSTTADVFSLGVTMLELLSHTAMPHGPWRFWDNHTASQLKRVAEKASASDADIRYREAGEVSAELARIERAYRVGRPVVCMSVILILLMVLGGSVRGIIRDARSEDIKRRAARHLDKSRAAADRILEQLAADPEADVTEDTAVLFREITKAGSLSQHTDDELQREIREQKAFYYELRSGMADTEGERIEYCRKAIAEIITLMETEDEEELCYLRLKGAELSRIVGDTGSAERFYAQFIASKAPAPEEIVSALGAVICMRLYEERNIDAAREALDEVLKLKEARNDGRICELRRIIEAEEER